MATNTNLSISDNNSNIAIENTNSISDESIFENAIPYSKEKEIIESDEIKKEDEIKTLDFFDIQKQNEEKIKKEEERIESLIKDEDIFSSAIEIDEPSTWDKMQYGWAKNDMVFGNLRRMSQNFWDATLDSEKTFEEAAIENAQIEQKEFDEKYWKFKGGKHDGAYSFIGESLTYALDPWYLGGYILAAPALIANPVATSVFLNAALLGGDNIIEQLAKQGKVSSWGSVGTSAAIGGGIGLVLPLGGKLLKNYLPQSLKDKSKFIAKFIDEKVAAKNGMSIDDVALIRNVANKEPVKKITNQINKLATSSEFKFGGSHFAAPVINAKNKYDVFRSEIAKELKNIIDLRKTTKKTKWGIDKFKIDAIKAQSKKILDLRIKGKLAKETWKKEKEKLLKRQYEKINKYYKLEGDRTAAILGQLTNNFNVGEKFLHAILANLAKPIFGALGGGAANVGASVMGMDVEDDIVGWMFAGFAFGLSLKAVGNSLYKIPLQQKDAYGKIIKNTATRFTLQKIRELTAGTLATKLNSFGGTTQKIGKLLLRQIDDPMNRKSVIADADKLERYLLFKANKLLQNTTPEERLAAITINRGNKIAKDNASSKILKLSSDLKAFTDEINLIANQAGFKSSQKIEDYFPRVLNREQINKDWDKAVLVFTDIFKKNYKLDDKKANAAAIAYLNAGQELKGGVINTKLWDKIITGQEAGQAKHFAKGDALVTTPVSNHIVQKRSLNGPYELVEKILEQNNYLVNDLTEILPRMVTNSVKSIAFARKFGVNGELLKPLLLEIKNKYDLLPKERLAKFGYKEFTKQSEAKHEASLVLDAVDAYFGKYTGIGNAGQLKNSVGILTMMSNLNMLGRVTISSLGDIVQIFQHSSNFSAAVKGMLRTNLFKSNWEKGLAREMNLHFTNEMTRSATKTAAMKEGQLLIGNQWIGRWGVKDIANPVLYNNLAFKAFGLEWLTGYARRFAYNAGTFDVYTLSRNYYKIVNGAKGANSKQAIKLKNDLHTKFGIKPSEALNIGQYKSLKAAIKNKKARASLNDVGIQTANRDALLPQADNRLLFTQSRTPWIRMLGQFLSWAQAKSASTNRMIKRVEDGDAKLLIKTLATIPIYAGIQQLREYAKYGHVTSDWEYDKHELLSKSWQLSGMTGWVSDLIFNRFLGPGSKQQGTNYFVSFPALNMLTNIAQYGLTFISGDKKKRAKLLDKKILPAPNWRKRFRDKFFPRTVESSVGSSSVSPGLKKGGRVGYEHGDEVILPQEKPIFQTDAQASEGNPGNKELGSPVKKIEDKDMNKKDMAAILAAGSIAAAGINFDMDKAAKNNILPKEKPDVVVEKTYKKVSDLDPEKKEWLFNTAEKVYLTNKNNVIPNDIILAINGGETGWGTSRFWEEGSNNLFNFQSFNDKEESIAAQNSNAKIKKFKTAEDSIKQFLNWIENKDSYAGVREEIKLYNEGEGSKERIIDAIAKTGFAEDKKWSGKIKSILNNRIDGKHKKELQKLSTILFKGPDKELKKYYPNGEELTNNTGEVSNAGKPIYKWWNPKESRYENVSEKSMTFNIGDKWINVPSIHNGVMYSEAQIKKMLENNVINTTSVHKSKEDAEKAAELRSNTLQ